MLMYPMYYVVFYDIDKPKTIGNAMNKRIDRSQWINICDGIIEKTVELDKEMFKIISVSTFNIINTVDNTLFAVCDVKKLSKNTAYITKTSLK